MDLKNSWLITAKQMLKSRSIKAPLLLLFICSAGLATAQLPMYDANFTHRPELQTKGDLAGDQDVWGMVDRMYYIKKAMVIEYYEMNTGRLVGFAGDTTQFDLRKMQYFSRSPLMKRLVKAHGAYRAHSIYSGNIVTGISDKDVIEILGKPADKDKRDGIHIWTYDGLVLHLDKRKVIKVESQ